MAITSVSAATHAYGEMMRWARCMRCGVRFQERSNIGQWRCAAHTQALDTGGAYGCCRGRAPDRGCTPMDHREEASLPWRTKDDVVLEGNYQAYLPEPLRDSIVPPLVVRTTWGESVAAGVRSHASESLLAADDDREPDEFGHANSSGGERAPEVIRHDGRPWVEVVNSELAGRIVVRRFRWQDGV